MMHLFDKRLLVVVGKGGTGRSLLAVSLGHLASRRGKRTLVCSAHSGTRYQGLLEKRPSIRKRPGKPVRLAENLYFVDIDPRQSRTEYGAMVLKNPLLHKLVFSNRHVNRFLDAIPGLAEWAMLGKATFYALDDTGAPPYDLVIFDPPATGHGLNMLTIPGAITRNIDSGKMYQEALLRLNLLGDDSRCAILPVTIPEELPVNETAELLEKLHKNKLPVAGLVVNQVLPDTLIRADEPREDDKSTQTPGLQIPALVPWTVYRDRLRVQRIHVTRLTQMTTIPLVTIPDFASPLSLPLNNDRNALLDACIDALAEQLTPMAIK